MPVLPDNATQLQVAVAMEDFCDLLEALKDEPKDPKYWKLYSVDAFITKEQIQCLIDKNEFYYARNPNDCNPSNA